MKNFENDFGLMFPTFGGRMISISDILDFNNIDEPCFNLQKEGSLRNLKKHKLKFGGRIMKNLFLIMGILVCIYSANGQTNETEKTSLFNAGIGTSIRMGTLLLPSVDVYFSLGPVELEGYWKYSEYNGDPLHSFGFGTNLFFYKTEWDNRFFLSYDYVLDTETEVVDYDPYKIQKGEGHIFCLGLQCEAPVFFKIGAMYNPTLKDSWDPRIEFGLKFYLDNYSYFSFFHRK